MKPNRMMPAGTNLFQITVGFGNGRQMKGCVKSVALGREAPFTSLSRMVLLIEEWLDTADSAQMPKPGATLPADFEIEILFRQNYSWQGKLRYLRTGQEAVFRSVLELLIQLETALAQ